MPVSKAVVKKLVDRLCTLPSAANEMFDSASDAKAAVRAELGRTIERNCGSDDHAHRTVENLMEGRFRPVPAELRAAAEQVPQKEALPEHCEICEGQPWITIERQIKDPSGVLYMAMGSKRCDCRRGQWFRQKDRENDAKRKAGLPV